MRRLAIRPGGIGDSILGFPALEHLGHDAELEVWVREEVVPLIDFAATHTIEGSGISLVGVSPASESLQTRLLAFDEIHTWYGSNREEFRAALDELHPRVFYHEALPSSELSHATDFFSAQVAASLPSIPRLRILPSPNRMIWIHPFSGSAKKNWLLERYQLLARWLETTGRPVQFVVAPHQRFPGAKVVDDLKDLAALLAGGSLYIGNDTGITHLAAAAGANTLALFGPTDPTIWAPRGDRVRLLSSNDLDQLSVERVLDAALEQTGFSSPTTST